MELDSINSSVVLALDTNIFIYGYDRKGSLGRAAGKVFDLVDKVNPKVFISALVFEEFLIKVYKNNLEKFILQYEDFLTGSGRFTVVSVDRQIARQAAKIRAEYRTIKAPDAIHVASAQESGAKIFLTFDRRIPRKIDNLSVVTP